MNDTITIGEALFVTLLTFVGVIGYVFLKTVIEHLKSK